MQQKLKVKKLRDNAQLPVKGSSGAGAYDVFAAHVVETDIDEVVYYLGIAVEIPHGYRLMISPRSSFTKTKWVMQNSPGIIDSDYRGELMVKFRAIDVVADFPYKEGDRIGQCYLEEVIPIEFEIEEALNETQRGEGGFGSTGV